MKYYRLREGMELAGRWNEVFEIVEVDDIIKAHASEQGAEFRVIDGNILYHGDTFVVLTTKPRCAQIIADYLNALPQHPTPATPQIDEAEGFRKALCKAIDFAEWGWTIIANAHGGDWEKASKDWQTAAAKYRDDFHNTIRFLAGVPTPATASEQGADVPLPVQLALRVLLNHIQEPESWRNCKTTVENWLAAMSQTPQEKC